jgi:hypothetical protein
MARQVNPYVGVCLISKSVQIAWCWQLIYNAPVYVGLRFLKMSVVLVDTMKDRFLCV